MSAKLSPDEDQYDIHGYSMNRQLREILNTRLS